MYDDYYYYSMVFYKLARRDYFLCIFICLLNAPKLEFESEGTNSNHANYCCSF